MPALHSRFAPHRAIGAMLLVVSGGCASGGATPAAPPATGVRVVATDAPPLPPSDGMPAGFGAAFASADTRARAVVYYQQCLATVLRLRASGTFGAAATAPRSVYCERSAGGEPLGGVFDIDTGYTRARRLTMIRLDGARPRYLGAIDTVRVAQEARLLRDITREVTPEQRKQGRIFTVVPLPQPDGTLEGWVIPWVTRARSAVLGGDIAIVRTGDGRLRRLLDRSATYKQIPLPPSGQVVLPSAEHDVPAVADLVTARSLAEVGREVTVTTVVAKSSLVAGVDPLTGARIVWQHARRTP